MSEKSGSPENEMEPDDSTPMQTLSDYNFRFSNRRRIWRPPTDFTETEDTVVVKVEAAGMAEDDFSITYVHNSLFISGVRPEPLEKVRYHQMEITYGEFSTEVNISIPVDREAIDASYSEGFLTVTLPKIK